MRNKIIYRYIVAVCILALLISGGVVGYEFYKHEKRQSEVIYNLENELAKLSEKYQLNFSDSKIETEVQSEERFESNYSVYPNGITFASKGGEGLDCPYDSYIGVQYAYENGYDVFRVNICRTSDGILVISHDETINKRAREKDGSEIVEPIYICEHTLEELNAYDYGIAWGEEFSGLKITTFDEIINITSKLGMRLDIEWKYPDPTKDDFEYIYETLVLNGYTNKNWHWIGYKEEYFNIFAEICDYVDVEVYVNPENPDWDLIKKAQSDNHNVIVGYWTDNIPDDFIVKLRKYNIIQNRGTAADLEGVIRDIEHGVTEIECCFKNPKRALIEYAKKISY